MYFYVYEGKFYWGRYQSIASELRHVGWIFRNKPAKLDHWYISGPYCFYITKGPLGHYNVSIIYQSGQEHGYSLVPGIMYYLADGWNLQTIDRHQEARALTMRSFRNRLKEYKGRYFLPFHKHALCV